MSVSLESLMQEPPAAARRQTVAMQLAWFLIIGGGAALAFVGVSTMALGLKSGLPAWLVSGLCYAAFIVPVYLLHRRFSFRSAMPHRRALPRYVLVQVSGLILATSFSWLVYGFPGLPTAFAAALVIGLTSGVNFVILRLWAFTNS